jgi:hypothetical protein
LAYEINFGYFCARPKYSILLQVLINFSSSETKAQKELANCRLIMQFKADMSKIFFTEAFIIQFILLKFFLQAYFRFLSAVKRADQS